MLCGSLDGRGVWERMDTCISIQSTESLCCLPETSTALLIGYTPREDKKFLFLKYKIKGYGKSVGTHLKTKFKMLKNILYLMENKKHISWRCLPKLVE